MTVITGYAGSVRIGSASSSTFIAQIRQWQLLMQAKVIEVTTLAESGHVYQPAIPECKLMLTVLFDADDLNGQIALQNALLQAIPLKVNLYVDTVHAYRGDIWMTDVLLTTVLQSLIEARLKAVVNGILTYS